MNNELAKLKELAQRYSDSLAAHKSDPKSAEMVTAWDCATHALSAEIGHSAEDIVGSLIEQLEAAQRERDEWREESRKSVFLYCAMETRAEAAEAQVKELTIDLDKESEIRHRIHEELKAFKVEQRMQLAKVDIRGDGFWGRMAARESIRANKAEAELAAIKVKQKPVGAFHISGGEVEATSDYIEPGNWPVNDGIVEVYAHPAPALLPPEIVRDDADGYWLYKGGRVSSANAAYYNQALRDAKELGYKPMPVIVLKGGSLKSDGNIWYKSETVVQLIRAAGLEVKP